MLELKEEHRLHNKRYKHDKDLISQITQKDPEEIKVRLIKVKKLLEKLK